MRDSRGLRVAHWSVGGLRVMSIVSLGINPREYSTHTSLFMVLGGFRICLVSCRLRALNPKP